MQKGDSGTPEHSPLMGNRPRTLRVRGPDRHWHRYVIFPDRIESVEMYGMSVSERLGQQTLQEM